MAKAPARSISPLAFDLASLSPKQLVELKSQAEVRLQESLIERCQRLKAEFKARCDEEGLTLSQVFYEGKQGGIARAKYKNPQTGQTWSGRGKKPSWLIGNEEDFAIS